MKPYFKNELTTIYNGDCLEVMDYLIEQGIKVDAIITDPPYGTTACSWDSVIPFDDMWKRLKLLRKDKSAIVLFGNEPFSSKIRISNLDEYKYDWKWLKESGSNFLNASNNPIKMNEDIIVFSNGTIANGSKNLMNYFPQGLIKSKKIKKNNVNSSDGTIGNRPSRKGNFVSEFSNYPNNILKFNRDSTGLHPTQKPLELMKYLIETYTKKGDLILDFTSGSFTTCVAADQLGRRSIGIEMSKEYCNVGIKRLESLQMRLDL